MTNIIVKVNGSVATASANGKLTSGMVGVPVSIQYDSSWDGLIKVASFRCGKFVRSRRKVENETTVPWEVMRESGRILEIGIEGRNDLGDVVIPTTWSPVGRIYEGATSDVPGAENPEVDSDIPSMEEIVNAVINALPKYNGEVEPV